MFASIGSYVSGHGEGGGRGLDRGLRTPAPTTPTRLRAVHGSPGPAPRPQGHFLVRFWRSAVGKKWVMAISGIILLGFVLAHMIGNLKVFLGKEHLNVYGEWLRTLGEPAFPRTVLLWALRIGAHPRVRRSTSSPRTSSPG